MRSIRINCRIDKGSSQAGRIQRGYIEIYREKARKKKIQEEGRRIKEERGLEFKLRKTPRIYILACMYVLLCPYKRGGRNGSAGRREKHVQKTSKMTEKIGWKENCLK